MRIDKILGLPKFCMDRRGGEMVRAEKMKSFFLRWRRRNTCGGGWGPGGSEGDPEDVEEGQR